MFTLTKCTLALALATIPSSLAWPTLATTTNTQAATNLCGDYDYIILQNTPWIVYNMLYNADQIVGSQCTGYKKTETADDGGLSVVWNSTTEIEYVESTNNVPKGYSFVGLTEGLENTITDIKSIPATYNWTRTNTTSFKGNICFDFMTSPTKGDSTSTSAQELMLWLQYTSNQYPIGWTNGPTHTINSLFGTSWKLYQDKNTDTGITVSTLLPETQFEGGFEGDLREWLVALVGVGVFGEGSYVNVGNAGTEFFYGNAVMDATLGLQINLA